jgi:DNA replication protein DnaC
MTDRILVGNGIPAAFRFAFYDDYKEGGKHHGSVRVAKEIREWWPTVSCPGLLLVGGPGKGKTLLASAALNELQEHHSPRGINRIPRGERLSYRQMKWPVYFVQMAEYIELQLQMMKLHDGVKAGWRDPEELQELENFLQNLKTRVKLLVLDDVGKEHRTASRFAIDNFDLLLRTRFNNGLFTIITSNLPLSQWGNEYSNSMQNFIERSFTVIKFPRRPGDRILY